MKNRKPERAQARKTRSKKRGEKQSARRSRNTKRAAEFNLVRQRVDEFAKAHPGFDKLADEVIFWLKKKLNLDDAYRVATVLDKLQVKVGRAPP